MTIPGDLWTLATPALTNIDVKNMKHELLMYLKTGIQYLPANWLGSIANHIWSAYTMSSFDLELIASCDNNWLF